jgi:trans-2,3-dihydro-3-hydroxyanthranilate isomerase
MAPVREADALSRVAPDYDAIEALLAQHDAVVVYLAWCDEPGGITARGFARIMELGEDPATGSAVGPLCAYLHQRRGVEAITVRQGEAMGRPSLLEAEVEDGRVRVSGLVIPVMDGTVELPVG